MSPTRCVSGAQAGAAWAQPCSPILHPPEQPVWPQRRGPAGPLLAEGTQSWPGCREALGPRGKSWCLWSGCLQVDSSKTPRPLSEWGLQGGEAPGPGGGGGWRATQGLVWAPRAGEALQRANGIKGRERAPLFPEPRMCETWWAWVPVPALAQRVTSGDAGHEGSISRCDGAWGGPHPLTLKMSLALIGSIIPYQVSSDHTSHVRGGAHHLPA